MRFKPIKFILSTIAAGSFITYLYIRNLDAPRFPPFNDENILHHTLPDEPLNNLLQHPPLRTSGRLLLDDNDEPFTLSSVNWYGASDELFIPSGLNIRHRTNISKLIRRMGFNSVRLPYSDEMVLLNPLVPSNLISANSDLVGLRALDVYFAVVESLTGEGLALIPNNHITQGTWCCGINPCDASWRNDYLGPVCRVKQTEEQWIQNWEKVMLPLINNSLVIGADLRNEVRGLWGTMSWESWAKAAEKAGNRLLSLNKRWIMFVEGVSSANDLRGVRTRPVVLDVDGRIVYSAHVYSWSGWGSLAGIYAKRRYDSFKESMMENWGFLLEEGIAPVWVGEFGAPRGEEGVSRGDRNYWVNLMRVLREVGEGGGVGFGYWALNPRKPHEGEDEMYGLVRDDWERVIWDYRMRDLRALIASMEG